MTADYIAFHADLTPDATAIVKDGAAISFARFDQDVRKFAAAIGGMGVRRGGTVVVQCADPYCHWLMLLACERLDLVTASLAPSEGRAVFPLLESADLVLSEQPLPAEITKPRRAVTAPWLEALLASHAPADEPIAQRGADDAVRITRTSGTTGEQKRLLYTLRIFDAWIGKWATFFELSPRARFLADLPFTVGGAHTFASAVVRWGGTVVFESRMTPGQAIAQHGITHVLAMPLSLARIIETLPPDATPGVRVALIGGGLPPALRRIALARLASEVCESYAANEVGTIAATIATDPAGQMTLRPGVEVEILDDAGRSLPPGQMGAVRVRSEHMFTSYLGDAEATARMFRDGWFHPGDVAILHAPRRIEVLGRSDEILNIGGLKILPAPLEDEIRAKAGLEAAISSLANAAGIEELWIAVAGPPDPERGERARRALGGMRAGLVHVVALAAIPRTETGKIRRAELRQAIARARTEQGAR
jgi:acyl-coenzyme A synthetase/AMP-(fatty) acid ligase